MRNITLSVIVPAWNEEKRIGTAIASLQRAAAVYERERGGAAEIIVVDNNSSDRTSSVARHFGATVVFEPINNIQAGKQLKYAVNTVKNIHLNRPPG